jgi:hypothetical protein
MLRRCGGRFKLSRGLWDRRAVMKVYYCVQDSEDRTANVYGGIEDATGCRGSRGMGRGCGGIKLCRVICLVLVSCCWEEWSGWGRTQEHNGQYRRGDQTKNLGCPQVFEVNARNQQADCSRVERESLCGGPKKSCRNALVYMMQQALKRANLGTIRVQRAFVGYASVRTKKGKMSEEEESHESVEVERRR